MTTRENDITESFTGDRMSILNEIAARTKERIAEEKFKFPLRELISQQNSDLAKHAEEKISFLEALKKPGMSYICEVQRNMSRPVLLQSPASQSPFISRAQTGICRKFPRQ